MTTVADLINETKSYLYSGYQDQIVFLAEDLDTTETDITLDALTGINTGQILSCDLELMYVRAVAESSLTATVVRGFRGTVAATHTNGAIVTVRPKFSDFDILRQINNDLIDLSSPSNGLFRVRTTAITPTAGIYGYNLTPTDIIDIIDIRRDIAGTSKLWPYVENFQFLPDADTTEFASGYGLVFPEGGYGQGELLHIRYKAPYTAFTSLSQDASVGGLQTTVYDLPPLGAAIRLMAGREIKRNYTESQGETRRANEVPPGAVANSSRPLTALRQTRIHAEAARLANKYSKAQPLGPIAYPLTSTGYRR